MSTQADKRGAARVLIIDPDAARAEELAAALCRRLACTAETAAGPPKGAGADLVILACDSAPSAAGVELLRRLAGSSVIVVSARAGDREVAEWIRAGAEDVLGRAGLTPVALGDCALRVLARAGRRNIAGRIVEAVPGAAGPRARRKRVSSLVAFLQAAALTDPLTGLANRRALDARLERLVADALRERQDLSVLMIDVDDFKRMNDQYGHARGDDVLVLLGEILRSQSRRGDLAARYGGDEMVLLLPGTDATQACAVAERVRAEFAVRSGVSAGASLSTGVAGVQGSGAQSPRELLALADAALYAAKRAGKGCTRMAADAELPGTLATAV